MKYIDDLNNMNNVKKFSSKRNSVYLIKSENDNFVIKKFSEKEFFDRELIIYYLLEKEKENNTLKYPRIINYKEEELAIKFEYIDGETLLNNFESCEQEKDIDEGIRKMILLFEWIELFQTSLTHIKNKDELLTVGLYMDSEIIKNNKVVSLGDVNFKNFVQMDNELYGLDFENVNIEYKITDYTKSLAYMMTYKPIGSEYKKNVFEYLIIFLREKYKFSLESIYKSYNNELKKIEGNRSISLEDLYMKSSSK